MKVSFFMTTLLTLGICTAAYAQDGWQEASPEGLTDWTNGYVEATGQGTSRYMGNRVQEELMAKQAARTTAQARLLEIIKGIRLTGLTTIGTLGSGDTRAATRIKGTLRGARQISEQISWHADKTSRRGETVLAEVTLRVCITPTCQATTQNLTGATLDLPKTTDLPVKPVSSGNETTSVIIDLEQALYLPALAPEIIDENDKTIYSQDSVNAEITANTGLIHYAKDIAKAQKMSISGSNPLIIKAVRVSPDNRIVLSESDGQKITPLDALKQGHLIVALD